MTIAFQELLCGLSIPFISYIVGRDIGSIKSINYKNSRLDVFTVLSLSIVAVVTPIVLIKAVDVSYASDIFSACYGPVGAIPRYLLSISFNSTLNTFQLGTFLSNIIAVVIGSFLLHCQKLECSEALVGVCGSLSTVSGWVNDSYQNYQISKFAAYFYALSTVTVGVAIAAVNSVL